jgi:hypothetical protein
MIAVHYHPFSAVLASPLLGGDLAVGKGAGIPRHLDAARGPLSLKKGTDAGIA